MRFRQRNILIIGITVIGLLSASVAGFHAASVTYTYDELNRLIRVEYPDEKIITYSYDDVGNRLQVVVAQPCELPAAKIGSIFYYSLQEAYNAAGNGDTIKCRALRFTESLTVNRNITVTLDGGYNCDFTTNAGGQTPVKGMITTTTGGGTITIRNFRTEQ